MADYNDFMEQQEQLLHQRFRELVQERRYQEAEQVAHLMQVVGII